MPEPPVDFASLIQRARSGDHHAIEEVVRRYEPEIRMVAHVRLGPMLRPYVDTVDLVQSVHKSLLRGLRGGRFDISAPEQLVALALTMVRRKVARQWRRHKRHERGAGQTTDTCDLAQYVTAHSTPVDPAQAAELSDAVIHVCQQLNEDERRLIELRIQGYSTAEAARELGLDPDILRVQLSRLRRRLRSEGVLAEWL